MSRQIRRFGSVCWVVVLLCTTLPASPAAPPRPSALAAAMGASNAFGFDLYTRIKAGGGNLICSPVSAAIALDMALAGARGGTRRQLAHALHLDREARDPRRAQASFGSLFRSLNKRDGQEGLTLQVANRLWGQQDLHFDPTFFELLRARYDASLQEVDFARRTEEARVAINRWAAAQTHDRIRDLLQPGDLDPDSRLVLTNAVYFKGDWAMRFTKAATSDRPFAARDHKVVAKMMHQQASFRYARARDVQVVELTYRGGTSMVVVLPDAVDGLEAVEARLGDSYQGWIAALDYKLIDLELPRWTATSRVSLAGALAAMGMPTAFTPAANFTGMSPARPLFINKVLQEAFVSVDEEGTEAAAVTAVVMGSVSDILPSERPLPFHADHPFMYLLRDTTTGAILFIGRVVDPLSAG